MTCGWLVGWYIICAWLVGRYMTCDWLVDWLLDWVPGTRGSDIDAAPNPIRGVFTVTYGDYSRCTSYVAKGFVRWSAL